MAGYKVAFMQYGLQGNIIDGVITCFLQRWIVHQCIDAQRIQFLFDA